MKTYAAINYGKKYKNDTGNEHESFDQITGNLFVCLLACYLQIFMLFFFFSVTCIYVCVCVCVLEMCVDDWWWRWWWCVGMIEGIGLSRRQLLRLRLLLLRHKDLIAHNMYDILHALLLLLLLLPSTAPAASLVFDVCCLLAATR